MKTNWKNRIPLVALVTAALSASAFGLQTKIGDKVPSFSVTSMGGKQLFLKDMQTGGPIFIYFMRDGDSVSQQDTTYVNSIIRAYGASRVTWYGVVNAREDRARSFQAEANPAFQLERDENLAAVKAFSLTNAPAVFEISRRGTLMNSWLGYSATNLKAINAEVARVSRRHLEMLDFSGAPSTAQFGSNYSAVTGSSG